MVEVHPVMVYMYEGDSCDRPYVAHSGLVDQLATGSTKDAAIECLKRNILSLRDLRNEQEDIQYERQPKNSDAFNVFRKNPSQYKPKFDLIDKDTWLWVYDLGAIEDPKWAEVLGEGEPNHYETIMKGVDQVIEALESEDISELRE